MCGICGTFGFGDKHALQSMMDAITHRGPDAGGKFTDNNIFLGSRRLSIIDLKTGDQPISNEDGSIWIVYNGEVYNFQELRESLKGHKFKTKTDTEVLVHLYEQKGEDFVKDLNGCFSFALWDSNKKQLLLYRDRLGIKPLYYTQTPEGLAFSSEIKSLLTLPGLKRELNTTALDFFLSFRYLPAPYTLLKNIMKLPPAHYLKINSTNTTPQLTKYWEPKIAPSTKPLSALQSEIIPRLKESIRMRLVSDVPLGAYLSGGLDSSTIVSLMSEMVEEPIKTFSIGFEGEEFTELSDAKLVSEAFNTDHQEFVVKSDRIDLLPKVIYHLDDPISDPTVIPLYLLSQLARKKVKVVLSGEGADELFAGYMQHKVAGFEKYVSMAPSALLKASLAPIPHQALNKLFSYPMPLGKAGKQRLLQYASRKSFPERYLDLVSAFNSNDKDGLYGERFAGADRAELQEFAAKELGTSAHSSPADRVLSFELKHWLPGFSLEKEDKLSMANSLELRVPFLDHTLVEYAFTIPYKYKVKKYVSKYIFRQAIKDKVPPRIYSKPKHPFFTPTHKWFNENLRDIFGYVFDSPSEQGYFKKPYIQNLIQHHERSPLLYSRQLWCLLSFEIWRRLYIEGDSNKPELSLEKLTNA